MNAGDKEPQKKRRKNRRLTEADPGLFVKKYGRKSQKGHEPNRPVDLGSIGLLESAPRRS